MIPLRQHFRKGKTIEIVKKSVVPRGEGGGMNKA